MATGRRGKEERDSVPRTYIIGCVGEWNTGLQKTHGYGVGGEASENVQTNASRLSGNGEERVQNTSRRLRKLGQLMHVMGVVNWLRTIRDGWTNSFQNET